MTFIRTRSFRPDKPVVWPAYPGWPHQQINPLSASPIWDPNLVSTVRTDALARQHYNDDIMSAIASQITSLTIVYPTAYSRRRSKKHQNSASLAFVRGIHRWPVNSPHKGPVTRKMFPFDDVIMKASAGTVLALKLHTLSTRFLLLFFISNHHCWPDDVIQNGRPDLEKSHDTSSVKKQEETNSLELNWDDALVMTINQ